LTAHGEEEARELEPCLRKIKFASVLTSRASAPGERAS